MNNKLNLLGTVVLFLFLCSFTGCSMDNDRCLTITGSTALAPLVKYAAEDFMALHPGVAVRVTGGGSYGGFYQVLSGAADIGISSIPATAELRDQGLVEHTFAIAPIVFIAHPGVGKDNLTQEEMKRVLTGEATNWREVGGEDLPVILVHRQRSSGIRSLIEEQILTDEEFGLHAVTQDSCGSLRQVVATTPGAIGYTTMFYADDSVKVLNFDSIPCEPGCVKCEAYSLLADGILLTNGKPSRLTKQFIDYITSEHFFNSEFENMGFYKVGFEKAS